MKSFTLVTEVDGSMWIGFISAFVWLSILLPVLTHEALFGKKLKAGKVVETKPVKPLKHVRSRDQVLMVNLFDRRAWLLRRK